MVGVITGHCIMDTHTNHICLRLMTNEFCKSCRDEKKEEIVFHLLDICSALCLKLDFNYRWQPSNWKFLTVSIQHTFDDSLPNSSNSDTIFLTGCIRFALTQHILFVRKSQLYVDLIYNDFFVLNRTPLSNFWAI